MLYALPTAAWSVVAPCVWSYLRSRRNANGHRSEAVRTATGEVQGVVLPHLIGTPPTRILAAPITQDRVDPHLRHPVLVAMIQGTPFIQVVVTFHPLFLPLEETDTPTPVITV